MILLNASEVRPTHFPDGTSQVWKLGDHMLPAGNVVQWRFEHETELVHLLQLSRLLRDSDLIVPYLPYARQDKPVEDGLTFALRPFADVLNLMGWRKAVTCDVHSHIACDLVHGLVNVPPPPAEGLVIFPDSGAAMRYSAAEAIVAEKVRDQSTGRIVSYHLPDADIADRDVTVVDDICDGGATFLVLGEEIRKRNPGRVTLQVTHGLFSKGVDDLFRLYDQIATTDSVYKPQDPRVVVNSVLPLLLAETAR